MSLSVQDHLRHQSRILERQPCARAQRRTQCRVARRRSPARHRRQGGREEKARRGGRKRGHPLPHLHDRSPHQLADSLAQRPRHLPPRRTHGDRDRGAELATRCGLLDLEHLREPTAAGLAPRKVVGDVRMLRRHLGCGQPDQKIHRVLHPLAAEQLAHAVRMRRPLARRAFVEEAHHGPAIRAPAHMLFRLAALIRGRTVAHGLLGDRVEQDRDRLVVIHGIGISVVARGHARGPVLGFRRVDARRTGDVSGAGDLTL